MTKVLGILGKPGAGKDTFCDFFEENHSSVEVIKFSDSLTQALEIFIDEVKREDQQWLVNGLRDRFGEDILARAVEKRIKNTDAEFVLLNGVRVQDDFKMVKRVGGFLVYVRTKPKLRWKRMKERGEKKDDNVSFEKFLELDEGRSEREIEKIGKEADLVIDNNKSKDELEKQAQNLIKELTK